MALKNLSIRTRLLAGFGTLAGVVLVVSAYSLHALGDATEGFNGYLNGLNARAEVAAQVRSAVDRRAIAARNLVLVTDPADLEREQAEALRAHQDVQARLARLNEMVRQADASDEARKLVEDVARVEAQYGTVATAIVGLAVERKVEEAVSRIDKQCRPLLAALTKATDAYADFTKARQKAMERKLEADYEHQRNLLILISLVSAAIAAAGGVLVTRAITRPIERAVEVADTVAAGNLGVRIVVDRNDETGRLLAALRDMNERLTATVTQVRASSANIALSTSEIAAGNADLSSRTEEQAASLEQTAASMEELTETVRQNTDNARQASELARNAAEVAQRGSTTVQRVVGTMQDISASSAKIAEITGIIEGIAFQTNILALNAAVEAARAGEQGRGFAVVASEVRALAHRSSGAAKEIKELIEASGRQVQDGSSLASEAGQTMAEVTQAVARVTGIVEDIATASAEQSRGIEQVNQAIVQIDQVTQQNASLVNEAAMASRALEEQGRELSEVVAFFRLPGEGGGRVGAPGLARRVVGAMATA
ncbi:methyl-accepting chemotaxis protein [Cupriavidus oxalaticus]|uniref:HAMP domain-containing protein n=1 Tax=Cupriavidus oxalaticus TaxID=96344 RepID=A0A375GEK0_9BURK|nr:methyl-accepting chemotaxis protein [Cupriavidus oxalaticus]QRQ84146.1 HAMP domain-containing protein [Cupriavidus oxalaticus]QRQ91765.1 HAMP domain-containing protein [Cupriavidus oxalaticus]WQD86352.1 methyl-accepting chemotaxis protein [Cupriavidus oxalaticus]SPC17810.1 Methyl-accepting chemotaxis protein [Cupriavidus oxalaticus]